jgi:hypothetical protein
MLEILYTILPYVIGIAAGIFGSYFAFFKGRLKEVVEFVAALQAALEDDNVTKEEIEGLVKEFKDIFAKEEE